MSLRRCLFIGDHKVTTSVEGTGPDDATLRLLRVHCGWSCSKCPGVVVTAKMSHTLASNDGRRDFHTLPLGCQAGCETHRSGCSLLSFFLLIRNGNKQANKQKGFEVIMIGRRLQIIHPSIFILLICNRVAGPAGLASYSMFRSSQQWFPTFPAERTPGTSWPLWQVLDLPWGLCTSRQNNSICSFRQPEAAALLQAPYPTSEEDPGWTIHLCLTRWS